jgi:hypothetical protein
MLSAQGLYHRHTEQEGSLLCELDSGVLQEAPFSSFIHDHSS